MYIPTHFEQRERKKIDRLIQQNPLGIMINQNDQTFTANHLPFHFSPAEKQHGVLRCHVAKANPVWQHLIPEQPVLVIFQGPETYITPNWYPSKQEHGKVVPTWNYATVHVQAHATITRDGKHLRTHLEHLVDQNEAKFRQSWAVGDAPEDFTNKLIEQIVGIELVITDIEAKWKVSQNQSADNLQGVLDGLSSFGNCPEMVEAIEQTTTTSR